MQADETYKYIAYSLFVILDVILIVIFLKKSSDDNFTPELFFPIAYLTYYSVGFIFIIENVPLKEILLFLIGIIAYFSGISFIYIAQYKKRAKNYDYSYHRIKFHMVYAGYLVIGFLSTIYVFYITDIPLFQSEIDVARESVSEYAYIATLGRFLSVAFMIGFSYIFISKKESGTIPHGILLSIFAIFFISILHGSRELPISILLMALFFFNYYVRRVKKATLIKLLLLIIVIGVAISFYRAYALLGEITVEHFTRLGENPIILLYNIMLYYFSQEFSVSLNNFSQFINIIPKHVDYQYGKLFLSPLLLPLPGEQKVPGAFIKEIIGGEWTGAGASATLIGIFYADGGAMGVVLGMFMVGCLLKALHKKAVRNPTSILWVGLYSFFLWNALTSLRSNFTQGFDVVFMPCLITFFHFLTVKKRRALSTEGKE